MTLPNTAAHRGDRRLWLERLEPRAMMAATDLRITEFLASNDNGLLDAEGDASDWLEIYNSGTTTVNLTGLHLTDSAANKTKYTFPADQSIAPGGYRVVFASSKNAVLAGGELHTNFALSAGGEYLGLIDADGVTVIDEYTPGFPEQFEDVSYGREMQSAPGTTTLIANGATARAWVPTSSIYDATWRDVGFNDAAFNLVGPTGFGFENNPGDAVNYTAELGTLVPNTTRSLYMRQTFNLATLAGIDRLTLRMRYDDGFFAYINGEPIAEANAPETLQWNSFAATTHDDNLAEQFIEFDVSTIIPKLKLGANVLAIHGMNINGGSDMLIAPELVAQAATLVTPERLGYFDVPTPGYGNGENYLGFAEQPTPSVPHGFYTTPQSVTLSTSLPGMVIVYTTDGSTPTVNASLVPTNGTLYTTPINVSATTTLRTMSFKADYKPSFVTSSTYIFLDDVLAQGAATPPGWATPGTNGQDMDYGIDPAIITKYGATALKNSLQSIPTLSITTDLANLFDPATGIYVNAQNDGRDWERPASVELINPDGSPGFSANAGLRIRGGYSRGGFNPKHAFRFYFRSEYGDGKLAYPLFGEEGSDEFDVMDLRTDQNYSWSNSGDTQHSFVREVFGRDLQRDLNDPYTRSRWYHLYIDGQYFGVFQTQERVEEDYASTYLGGEDTDYDIVKHGLNDGGGTLVDEGNDAGWFQLFTLAQNLANNPNVNANNYWTMQGMNPDGTRNTSLPVLLDVDNLINYELILFYTGGYDSGISRFLGDNQANNWYGVYNRVTADQGFQFFIHDNEHSLGAGDGVHGTLFIDRTGPFNNGNQSNYSYFNPSYLHQDLLAHPEYRQRVIEKVQEYFFNNGPMTQAASIARMQERIAQIDPAVISEAARWGDSKTTPARDKTTWLNEVNWLINSYFPARTMTVVNQLRADALYATPPTMSLAAGAYSVNTPLSMSATGGGAGVIYFTTDGVTDPRLTGGEINPAATLYTSPIPLTGNPTIRARFRASNGAWSVLVEVPYTTSVAGDYSADGVVDGQDFLLWQRQLGSAANPVGSGADGNRDGAVNAADLTVWQQNFGVETPMVAASVQAPGEYGSVDATEAATPWSESTWFDAMLFAAQDRGVDPALNTPLAMDLALGLPASVSDPGAQLMSVRSAFRPAARVDKVGNADASDALVDYALAADDAFDGLEAF